MHGDQTHAARGDLTVACVATETRHLDWLGQLGEVNEASNTDAHSARSEAQTAQESTAEPDEKALQSKEQSTQQRPN